MIHGRVRSRDPSRHRGMMRGVGVVTCCVLIVLLRDGSSRRARLGTTRLDGFGFMIVDFSIIFVSLTEGSHMRFAKLIRSALKIAKHLPFWILLQRVNTECDDFNTAQLNAHR